MSVEYPASITSLPEIDTDFTGVRGWIAQGDQTQVVFFDVEAGGVVPPHSHGEQWGIVVDGEIEFTIGGETRIYRKGDTYHIPAGVVHSAAFRTRFKAIDFFPDPDRHRAKA